VSEDAAAALDPTSTKSYCLGPRHRARRNDARSPDMYAKGEYVRAFGSEVVKIVPVTLPELSFLKKGPPIDDPERRETAAKFLELRTKPSSDQASGCLATRL
jgi:hypothetical protein